MRTVYDDDLGWQEIKEDWELYMDAQRIEKECEGIFRLHPDHGYCATKREQGWDI